MGNSKSFLFGVVLGSVIGGVSVLLSTPATGKELREKVKTNKADFEGMVSQLAIGGKELKEQVALITKKGVHVLADFTDDVKQSIQQWRQDVEGNQKSIQKELSDIEKTLLNLENSLPEKQG